MDKLTNLAVKHGTDKWGKHHYTPFYERILLPYKDKEIRILEIGVAEGAGLRMFREFLPKAQLFGMDNDIYRTWKEERINVMHGSQNSAGDLDTMLSEFGTNFDLVIDDGSHVPSDQIFTALYLMRRLDFGVTYVIEDVASRDVAVPFLNNYDVEVKEFNEKRYDDRLIVLKHKQ